MPGIESTAYALARSERELGLALDDVVVVLSSNEAYAPYLSVVVQSLCESAGAARRYDVVVLTDDLSAASVEALTRQVAPFPQVHLGFLDVRPALEGVELSRHNRFGREAYYRLLAPTLLPGCAKAVYLDADLVILHDIAELFDVDVSGVLLAAVPDADTAGQIAGYDPMVRPYLEREVGIRDLSTYFQSGVLLLNLEEFRRSHPTAEMMALAEQTRWRWPDQDLLNSLAQGDYVRLDPRWNVLHDWWRLRRAHIIAQAPEELRRAYDEAHADPWVVHYAGPDNRPWLYPEADLAERFWDPAERSAFHDELRRRLRQSRRDPRQLLRRAFLYAIYTWGMPAVDVVFPVGTRRRKVIIGAYEKLGGQCT